MEFIAIDVETANADLASICQIGIASYKSGKLIDTWKTYINPEEEFDWFNISIHGITAEKVEGCQKFSDIANHFCSYVDNKICVCHTHFDRASINQAFIKYNLSYPQLTWLDSALVARRTWHQFAWKDYGLKTLCNYLNYDYIPHDGLEDAKAAGHVIVSAIEQTGMDIDTWLKRVKQPIDIINSSEGSFIKRNGNPDGPLFGEVIVFTGSLSVHRAQAADMASVMGCRVDDGVNKDTTLLVVGVR